MKRWLKWLIMVVVVAAVGAGVVRALKARKAQQIAVAEATQPKVQTQVELAPSDVIRARTLEIQRSLPVSGSLKAFSTAVVKAKVAGEVQGLSVREGDAVKAGQVIGTVDTTEYLARFNQAQRQAAAAKAQIDIAQRQYDNNKALVAQGFISQTALDTSLATLEGAKASHEAAAAGVDVARKALDDTVLRAPISGVISQRLTQPGERVAIDGRVIEIVDLGRLELEASVSPTDASGMKPGQTAILRVEGSTDTLTAKVVRINPNAQVGSRNVLAYLEISKSTGLRQGLFAEGTLGIARFSAVAIPLSAVRTDNPAPYVQLVDNGRVVHKPVQLGTQGMSVDPAEVEPMVTITGLNEGTTVIRGFIGKLIEGTAVKFTASRAASK